MSIEYCKISLIKLTGKQSKAGYQNSALKGLFGTTKVNPALPFSRSEFFQSGKRYAQGMSISGVQQKLSLKVNEKHELVVTAQGGEYLLKPSPEAYPYAAENEHAAMQVSRLMGIDTAQCALVSFAGGELAYLTKRFDRQGDGSKLHQEDLMQCFNLPSEDKYSKTYEEAGKLILEVTNGK
jgi:serine/threonine-protein kinase HipA